MEVVLGRVHEIMIETEEITVRLRSIPEIIPATVLRYGGILF